ncbi:MAG: HAMP domain-containing protein [Chloroflexi bacterium]|nr:HAMP domain-containing protein [Chloroflexota bacterium]
MQQADKSVSTSIKRRDSLRTRLMVLFLLMSVIPMALIGTISYIQSQQMMVNRIKSDLITQTSLKESNISMFLSARKDNMVVLAGTARVRSMDPTQAVDAMDQYFKQWGIYESLSLYDLNGDTIYRTDQSKINVAERDYFKNALDGKTSISEPILSKASGNIVFVVSSPVKDGEKVLGVIAGSLPTTVFSEILQTGDMGDGDGYLVNKEGKLITPSTHVGELKALGKIETRSELEFTPNTIAVKSILEGKSGVEEYKNDLGIDVIGSFLPVEGSTWGLVMEYSSAEVLEAINNLRMLYIVLIGLAVIIIIVLSIVVSNSITRPILQMSTISQQIARGEIPKEEIKIKGKDEIALLGKSFQEIIQYFKEISNQFALLADGDLTIAVKTHSEADILGHAFKSMVEKLREIIRQMAEHAGSLDQASNELASTASDVDGVTNQIATTIQQVAKGTSQQTEAITRTASNVEDLSSAVGNVAKGAQDQSNAIAVASDVTEKLSAAIEKVAGNAREVAKGSIEAKKAAEKGSSTVQSTLEEMQFIKKSVDLSSQKVQEMGDRSSKIGDILTTIEDIASQTNMLALNAAIEAARAGDTGKGFAVVADEVRKLAERVSLSTHEIDELIRGIQTSVKEAGNAMQQGTIEVEKGVEMANQAGAALQEILQAAETVKTQAEEASLAVDTMTSYASDLVAEVDTVSAVVEENTAATEEMAASTAEVSQAVENIASVSEENSAAAEEVSASTEEMAARVEEVSAAARKLSELSQQLRLMVQQFKTD